MSTFGLQLPSFTFAGVSDDAMFERIALTAVTAEESGFNSFFVMDHYHQIANIGPPTEPMLEAYTVLAGVAARTSKIKLGAMVTGVTYRNPGFLAKVATTLDIVSAGRAILGIGAAWNEEESRAYGYDWPTVPPDGGHPAHAGRAHPGHRLVPVHRPSHRTRHRRRS